MFVPTQVLGQQEAYQATIANISVWNLSGFTQIPTTKAETFDNAISYIGPEVIALN